MSATEEAPPAFTGWAIVELFGHRQLAGVVSETRIAGKAFVRLDIPEIESRTEGSYAYDKRPAATQFYSPDAVYSLTPSTEEAARAFLRDRQPSRYTQVALPAGDDGRGSNGEEPSF